jgi:hypothetical protein
MSAAPEPLAAEEVAQRLAECRHAGALRRRRMLAHLPWRRQGSRDPDSHQRRHRRVGHVPAEPLGQKQRHGAAHQHRDAISPLVRGRHDPLRCTVRRRSLDAPRVDRDVLRRRQHRHYERKRR